MRITKGTWYHCMLTFFLLALLTGTVFGYEVLERIPASATIQGGLVTGERVSHNINPPRSIAIEIDNPWMVVDLNGQGVLQLGASLPIAGSEPISRVIVNICNKWDLWHPYGSAIYQFRPNPITSNIQWKKYALNIDIPSLSWGATTASVWVIPAGDYMKTQPNRFPINPAPRTEMGPAAAQGSTPFPSNVILNFPKAQLEWIREKGQYRTRVGNVVLTNAPSPLLWDNLRPNLCYIGMFKVDLDQKKAYFMERDGTEVLTSLRVSIDDSPSSVYHLEPDLWY